MACQAIDNWTFSGLVGAFLDLAIAYLLLCASTVAFFATKFLGIFGLCLPCPCNGLFGNSNQNYCAQRLLLDCPIGQVSSVQLSVKNKFPFDSVFGKDRNLDSNMVLIGDGKKNVNEFVEFEGEASCRDENGVGSGVMSSERRIDMKGKGVMNQRPKGGIRRRRKGGFDCGKLSSSTKEEHNEAIPIIKEEHDEAMQGSSVPFDANRGYYEGKAPTVVKLGETAWDDFELSQPLDETKTMELKSDAHGVSGYVGDEKITIRVLKQKLEQEHAAHATLYLELEEERNAAASAADEAMAMILRLQAEKASIEMEARQYQRMIEEKAAYDAEEMNILKEILLRREREKHFLEKEVEAYRQMNYDGNEKFEGDVWDTEEQHRRQLVSSLDLTEDPSLMLHHLSEFIDKKERVKDRYSSNEVTSVGNFDLTFREEIPIRGGDEHADCSKQGNLERQFSHLLKCINDCNQELQEKKMISTDDDPYSQPNEGQILENQEHNFPILSENHGQNGQNVVVEKEVRVHDVHVIDDDVNGKKIEWLSSNDTSKVHRSSDVNRNSPSTSTLDAETNMNSSSSEMTSGLPPMAPRGISVISDLRRNSVSELDQERLKIDSEVAWLRERLRVVQEGRGKLNLSVEYREREKLELQLLEDIVLQLREIRQSSEPGKAVRQASLPLPSKVMSKKKRCRSASLGVDQSS